MGAVASDFDDCRSFQMDYRPLGSLWLSITSDAWGFRSSEALDGDYDTSTCIEVVLLRPSILGS